MSDFREVVTGLVAYQVFGFTGDLVSKEDALEIATTVVSIIDGVSLQEGITAKLILDVVDTAVQNGKKLEESRWVERNFDLQKSKGSAPIPANVEKDNVL